MTLVRMSAVRSAIESSLPASAEKSALLNAVEDAATPVPDSIVYRIVVSALGLAIFVPLVALINGDGESLKLPLPIATAALGALAGLLAPPPGG